MYGRATTGPGAMIIFDLPDPAMAPAMVGVAVSSARYRMSSGPASLRWRRLSAFGKRRGRSIAPTNRPVSGKSSWAAANRDPRRMS